MNWHPFDVANAQELDDDLWIAMKDGQVLRGYYHWRQGWNPHGFETEGAGRVGANEVTHTMPFVAPEHPSKEQA